MRISNVKAMKKLILAAKADKPGARATLEKKILTEPFLFKKAKDQLSNAKLL